MHIQNVSRVHHHHKFSAASLECLSQSENLDELCMLGGVSKDGTFGWLARGSFLEVFSTSSGQRLSAWCFGSIIKEPSTVITAVCECFHDKKSILVVATSTVNPEGLICLFDPKCFRIIKTIEIPYAVKSLEIVSCHGERHSNNILLSRQLKHFCGILAAGTHCGHIYLIDLCLDDDVEGCDELSPSTLQYIDANVKDIVGHRYAALSRSRHLCLELGDEFHSQGYYQYCKCDGTHLNSFPADDICVSCLKFNEKNGLLVAGFSFGAFQLWKLQALLLEYSSRYEDCSPPVIEVAYQEPENDPRNFCYLWVARGPLPSDSVEDYTSSITLYQLGYEKKTWYQGFGYLFEDLKDVGARFEHDLTSDPFNITSGGRVEGSRIISCFTIEDPTYQPLAKKPDVEDTCEDLSLCVFVWEAASVDPHAKPPCYLGLFDMNRWYHAHMPPTLRLYGNSCDVCPYFAMCSLAGIQQEADLDNIMAVYLNQRNLSRFPSVLIPEPEQHFYPSSLTFDVTCVTETGVVHASFLGIQRQILSDLQTHGPAALSEPHQLYTLCLHAGLLPRNVEAVGSTVPSMYKREALLTMILNHNMIGYLNRCATMLASGELKCDGWTLKSLLEWAWKRVTTIKESVDRLCVPLYDWSAVPLDKQTKHLLQQHCTALKNLSSLLCTMSSQHVPITELGHMELKTKEKVVTLITEHLDIVLWMCSVNLLPECSEEQMNSEDCFVYPSRALTDFYEKRHMELHKLHSGIKTSEVLLIDSLMSHIGQPLQSLWEKEGGTGQYPPPSLHAAVDMFLLEEVSLTDKQIILFYLLCDLLNSMSEEKQPEFHEKILCFTQKYDIPLGLSKLVQGMWLLDHKDFEDSMFYLLNPSVKKVTLAWQHRCILKALLYQGHSKLALQYLKVRSPPNTTPEDVKLKLTVLLSNGLTAEAFEFQRQFRDKNNVNDLLSHLFLGCQETKTVDQLLLLPFSEDEEHHLVNHLKSSSDLRSKELLVLYYLQRSRYVEAVRLNHRIKQQYLRELDPIVRERTRVRNCLVDGYHRLLPSIQRKLCLDPGQPAVQRAETRREFTRPTPLSTVVNKLSRKILTRSALIETVLNKVQELEKKSSLVGDEQDESMTSEEEKAPGPFVCTPLVSRTDPKTRVIPDVEYPNVVKSATSAVASTASNLAGLVSGQSPQASQSPCKSRIFSTPSLISDVSNMSNALKSCKRQNMHKTEALLLLNTPPVIRKNFSQGQTPAVDSRPHSILKVRHQPVITQNSASKEKLMFELDDSLPAMKPADVDRKVTMDTPVLKSTDVIEEDRHSENESLAMDTTPEDSPSATRNIIDSVSDFNSKDFDVTSSIVSQSDGFVLPELESRQSLHGDHTPLRTSFEVTRKVDRTPLLENQSDKGTVEEASQSDVGIEERVLEDDQSEIDQEETKDALRVNDEVTVNLSKHSKMLIDEVAHSESQGSPSSSVSELGLPVSEVIPLPGTPHIKVDPSDEQSLHADLDASTDANKHTSLTPSIHDTVNYEDQHHPESVNVYADGRLSVVVQDQIQNVTKSDDTLVEHDEDQIVGTGDDDNQHERLVSKDEYEENECEELVKELKTPSKVTKIVKVMSVRKKTSIKVIDIDQSESEDMAVTSTAAEDMVANKKSELLHTDEMTAESETESKADDIEQKMDVTEDDISVSESQTDTDLPHLEGVESKRFHMPRTRLFSFESTSGKTEDVSLKRTPLRRASHETEETPGSKKKAVKSKVTADKDKHDKVLLTPTRRSSRLMKSETISEETQEQLKTPRRKTRSLSHSTTPPKSNTSSPSSVESMSVTLSRRKKSTLKKKAPATPKQKTETRSRKTPSRTSSRASSPALSETGTEESFVMTLRSGHKFASRETTPDSIRTTSTLDDISEGPDYRFSVPLSLSDITEENSKPGTPVPDFIFSPPLTRSRQKLAATRSHTSRLKAGHERAASPAKELRKTRGKNNKTSKNQTGDAESQESPINFIAEVPEEELESDASSGYARSFNKKGGGRSLRPRRQRKMEPLKWN